MKEKHPFEALRAYLPDNTFEMLMPLLEQHKVHLTISKSRQTKLGDYRNAHPGKNHRISVNGDLNKYAFLITLLHELSHLLAFDKYGNRVMAHGKEWKNIYATVLKTYLKSSVFPPDIAEELIASLHNPGASTCSEVDLQRVLMLYDKKKPGMKLVEQIAEGLNFDMGGGRLFRKGPRLRKRYKCVEISTGKVYLFSPVYEVMEI